jgi:ADP-ribose pyrophosphatase YjhB (NUDIX family)
MRYHYCPKCGGKIGINGGKGPTKPQCADCGAVFYQNPVVGVAAIVIRDKKILLGKRNGSYQDKWCIPCGYVEWDEDVYDAVKREFAEETGLKIEVKGVYEVLSNFHNPEQHTVGIWFLAREVGGRLKAGDDLKEVEFFAYDAMPWLAFSTDAVVLKRLKNEQLIG